MFGEVLDINFAEHAQPAVDGDVGAFDALDFKAREKLAREVQACARSHYGAFDFGEDTLVVLDVTGLRLAFDVGRQGRVAQSIERFLELVVGAVVEETERAAAGCGVVDYLSHERVVIAEVELVADTDFACRLYKHVPEFVLGAEFAQEEHLDARAGLFLIAVKKSGEDARVVEHHYVAFVIEVKNLGENVVGDFACLAVYNHQARLIALGDRMFSNQLVREVEVEL